jgi:hypothetical protein
MIRVVTATAAGAAGIVLLAGCGSGTGKVTAEKSDLHAVASSSQVAADEQAAVRNVVDPCLSALHIAAVQTCIEGKVPPAQRQATKKCLLNAALADHVSRKTGRQTFMDVSAPQCVAAALATASPRP